MPLIHLVVSAAFFTTPEGFPPEDRFESIVEACEVLTEELVPEKLRGRVGTWCAVRSHGSSRDGRYESRIDGSWVHDRDRPSAWKFYLWGTKFGRIDPENCEYDRVDRSVPRPKRAKKMAEDWPFQIPKLTDKKKRQWLDHPYDMERFGTRGPHDNNVTVARTVLPGCWAPEALDRNDVAATVTILRAIEICEEHGCKRYSDIRHHW